MAILVFRDILDTAESAAIAESVDTAGIPALVYQDIQVIAEAV